MGNIRSWGIISGVASTIFAGAVLAAEPSAEKLHDGDYVGVIGDSITEQKLYSVFIEDYLLMCKPAANLSVTQFGWSGETARGFANRMQNDMIPFNVSAATTCFGMNDGGYSPMNPEKARGYHQAQTSVVEQLKKAGVRFIVVGSPGCVDSFTFRHDPEAAVMYNKTLAAERDIARQVAQEQGVAFADVYDAMYDTMEKVKAKLGKEVAVAGGDGVHPGANGHLVMAYAFLKGLGCDGNIGTITFDLAAGKATATDGHKVLSDANGVIEIESDRYPFCFSGGPKDTNGTRGITQFFNFNQDLNRFTLVVTGAAPGKQYKVTWGDESREFSGDALAKGINLPAEFDKSPFQAQFEKVEQVIRHQQDFETPLVKQLIHDLPAYETFAPELKDKLSELRPQLIAKDKPLREASEKAVQPVKHTIKVEAVK